MHGDEAVKLLKELRNRSTLAPFNDNSLRAVIDEANTTFEGLLNVVNELQAEGRQDEMNKRISIAVSFAACSRNKQCLLAYLRERLFKICDYRWELGAVLPPEVKENLSVAELDFFRKHNKILSTYMTAIKSDLAQDMQPPKQLLIQVKWVGDNEGTIETEQGPIHMRKSRITLARRADVEHLISQGLVEHVDG